MKPYAPFLILGLLLAGCGGAGPAASGVAAPLAQPERRLMSLADPTCGTVTGTGDAHPGDGKFYELTVQAEKDGALSKGSIVLYVMNDVLFGPNPVPEPVVYRGTVQSLALQEGRVLLKGVLSNQEAFTLRVEDNVTDAISDGPAYDYFSFKTEGLEVRQAPIHEGDLVVRPRRCD